MYILPQFVLNESRALGTRGPYTTERLQWPQEWSVPISRYIVIEGGSLLCNNVMMVMPFLSRTLHWNKCSNQERFRTDLFGVQRKSTTKHHVKVTSSGRLAQVSHCPRSTLSPEPAPGLTPPAGDTRQPPAGRCLEVRPAGFWNARGAGLPTPHQG